MRRQSIPVEEFKSNLREMVDLFPAETPILLITPPPFSPDMRQADVALRFPEETLELDRDIERTRSFARAVLEVASELSQTSKKGLIAAVEVHDSMEAAAVKVGNGDREKGLKHFLSDGLHLSPEGYKVSITVHLPTKRLILGQFVTEKVLEGLLEHFPQLHPDQIQRRFQPWDAPWDDINSEKR